MNEETQIVQCFLPNLIAGKYTIEITQEVKKKDENTLQNVQNTLSFGVDAARFTLNSEDIYSVYPPANTTGQYTNHFTHIVFNRRTLPWERTINGKPRPNSETEDPTPWMALLLLDEEDMKTLTIEQRPLSDVLDTDTNQSDKITRPKIGNKQSDLTLKLMEWEDVEQKCLTLDLSSAQYEKYLPQTKDLPYLAHSKIVTIDHKDKNGIGDVASDNSIEGVKSEKGYFSVLIGNRVIQKKQTYTAVVVSLEGHEDYLDKKPTTEGSVRMVVLANWSFNSEGTETFKTLLEKIQVKSLTLQSPLPSGHVLEKYINNGYVPMRHQMRNGAKNISWYRGAFVPNSVNWASTNFIKFSCSDTALYYDEGTGFLDISISAAWELGKIMALNNQEFTKAMVAWNNEPVTSSEEVVPKTIKKTQLVQWLNGETIASILPNNQNKTEYKPFPDVVKAYLKSIARLEGVPLSYILPDLKLIRTDQGSPDALALFYIDPLSIFALLDGAVSLSRDFTDTKTQVEGIMEEIYGNGVVTGFLLHSKLVSGWRGLEIKAFGENNELLTTKLRFERITPDIFLGIFQGKINKIVVTQPYEGLHFGLQELGSDGNTYIKNVKSKDGSQSGGVKIDIKGKASDDDKTYILRDNQVVFVEKMASQLEEQTRKMASQLEEQKFTSAEYAYQMIDSPIEASFKIEYKTK